MTGKAEGDRRLSVAERLQAEDKLGAEVRKAFDSMLGALQTIPEFRSAFTKVVNSRSYADRSLPVQVGFSRDSKDYSVNLAPSRFLILALNDTQTGTDYKVRIMLGEKNPLNPRPRKPELSYREHKDGELKKATDGINASKDIQDLVFGINFSNQ